MVTETLFFVNKWKRSDFSLEYSKLVQAIPMHFENECIFAVCSAFPRFTKARTDTIRADRHTLSWSSRERKSI